LKTLQTPAKPQQNAAKNDTKVAPKTTSKNAQHQA